MGWWVGSRRLHSPRLLGFVDYDAYRLVELRR
jgi:hypothetical protein